ncbi:hypothetical protein FOA52_003675 [Chlamydomonas sp. UWO 241]|nr:hypothetical protein FOA52_003675 [Chlamydomonas sp. UWO 241]
MPTHLLLPRFSDVNDVSKDQLTGSDPLNEVLATDTDVCVRTQRRLAGREPVRPSELMSSAVGTPPGLHVT